MRVRQLLELTDGDQIGAFKGLDANCVDRVLNLFPDITFEDARQYAADIALEAETDPQPDQPDWFAKFAEKRDARYKESTAKIVLKGTLSQKNDKYPDRLDDARDSQSEKRSQLESLVNNQNNDFIYTQL